MKRLAALVILVAAGLAAGAQPAEPRKVLRVAFVEAETSFDPVAVNDIYSRTITAHIFESLLRYDHLARPAKLRPLTAAAMPEPSADWKTWTVRLSPGIFFADDPAFKGVRRELVAEDYVYTLKRYADPANKAPNWSVVDSYKLAGLADARQQAIERKRPFDYAREIEGLRALDRYTLQFRLEQPRPRFAEMLAASDIFGAMAREVVAHYGDQIGAHPVGTGPFRLKAWRRSSLTVLEKNPGYRPMFYDALAEPGDAEGQALQARFAGRRLPMIDEVHVTPIEENQPMWLAFLNGELDTLGGKYGPLPLDYVPIALPGGKLAPHLAKRGIQASSQVNPDVTMTFFNMAHPVVGGYTPEKVALRRATGLGLDLAREIRLARRGQAIPAQSLVVPHTSGYDPQFKSESGDYSPARARALLDMFGYVDRDGDGFREQPDGSPLVLEYTTQSDQITRQFDELWQKDMAAIGIRFQLQFGKWPEQLRAARAGKLMMWTLASSATEPDGQGALRRLHGPQSGGQNLARFALPAFDALYERLAQLPDGPEREALFREAKMLAVAHAPYKPHVHRISNDLLHPWVLGYRRPIFWNEWWHWVDVDPVLQARGAR